MLTAFFATGLVGFASPLSQSDCKIDLYKPVGPSLVLKVPHQTSVDFRDAVLLDLSSNTVRNLQTTKYPGRSLTNWRFAGPAFIGDALAWFDRNGFWYRHDDSGEKIVFLDADEKAVARDFSIESGMSLELKRASLAKAYKSPLVKGNYYLRSASSGDDVVVQHSFDDQAFLFSDWLSLSDWLIDFDEAQWRIAQTPNARRMLQCRTDRGWEDIVAFKSSPVQLINVRSSHSQRFSDGRSYVIARENQSVAVLPNGKLARNPGVFSYAALPKCPDFISLASTSNKIGDMLYSFETETLYGVYATGEPWLSTGDFRLQIISTLGIWFGLGRIDSLQAFEKDALWNMVFSFENEDAVRSVRNEGGIRHEFLCGKYPASWDSP